MVIVDNFKRIVNTTIVARRLSLNYARKTKYQSTRSNCAVPKRVLSETSDRNTVDVSTKRF